MLNIVQSQLKRLHLANIIDTLPSRITQGHKDALSHIEWLQLLLQDEIEHRDKQSLERRLQRACFEHDQTLLGYELGHYSPNIQRLISELRTGDYLTNHNHVLIFGPTGTGKTHLAQGLGHQACLQGHEVRFIRSSKLMEELSITRAIDSGSCQRLKKYTKPQLLIIDDFGLHALSIEQANDLYEMVVEKEKKSSFIITSNKPIESWVELFPDPVLANAVLDRLAHAAYHLILEGESYRRKLAIGLQCPINPKASNNQIL